VTGTRTLFANAVADVMRGWPFKGRLRYSRSRTEILQLPSRKACLSAVLRLDQMEMKSLFLESGDLWPLVEIETKYGGEDRFCILSSRLIASPVTGEVPVRRVDPSGAVIPHAKA
jgi:hypothetical protein